MQFGAHGEKQLTAIVDLKIVRQLSLKPFFGARCSTGKTAAEKIVAEDLRGNRQTGLCHHVTALKGFLVHGDLMIFNHLNHMPGERVKCKVKPVVTVWRLSFDRVSEFLCDGLAIYHNRFGSYDLNTLVTFDTTSDDLKV